MSLVNDYKCIKILVSFFLFTFRLSEHGKVKGKIKKHVAWLAIERKKIGRIKVHVILCLHQRNEIEDTDLYSSYLQQYYNSVIGSLVFDVVFCFKHALFLSDGLSQELQLYFMQQGSATAFF